MPFDDHKALQYKITELNKVWQESIKDFKTNIGSKLTSQRNPQAGGRQIDLRLKEMADDPLFKRLQEIHVFRTDHAKLESVITSTFGKTAEAGAGAGGSDFRS